VWSGSRAKTITVAAGLAAGGGFEDEKDPDDGMRREARAVATAATTACGLVLSIFMADATRSLANASYPYALDDDTDAPALWRLDIAGMTVYGAKKVRSDDGGALV
jgi:hypothetical protein